MRAATRKSALALAQTRAFLSALKEANPGLEVEEVQVVTSGDRIQDRPLYEAGGKGLFVKEIEEALLEGRADFAVHSMKDLPAALPPGLEIVGIPRRADPRDVLLVRDGLEARLEALPVGAKVGSSSLRRRYLLQELRADLQFAPLRGNIDTRLKKLLAGEFDAILLAAAGLERLGAGVGVSKVFLEPEVVVPAVGQGILAIEGRVGDGKVRELLAPLQDQAAWRAARAERAVLEALGADCTVPLAAHLLGDRLIGWLWRDGVGRRAEVRVEESLEAGRMLAGMLGGHR
jgi:hydroxymethylbilane synthase